MANEHIKEINKSNKISFGEIVQRERKKAGKSLKDIETELTIEEEVIIDGVKTIETNTLVTASYLNRIENGSRENVSFAIVFYLIENLKLDINEVIKSFGFENVLSNDTKHDSIESIIRINEINAPVKSGQKEPLNITEKEILIRLIEDIFEFGTTNEGNTMYGLKKILDGLDDYRKSRRKLK